MQQTKKQTFDHLNGRLHMQNQTSFGSLKDPNHWNGLDKPSNLCYNTFPWRTALQVHELHYEEQSLRVHPTDPQSLLLSLCLIDLRQKTDGGEGALSRQPGGKLVLWSGLQSLLPSMSPAHRVWQSCADGRGCRVCCLFCSLSVFKLVVFGEPVLVRIWVYKTLKERVKFFQVNLNTTIQ